MTMMLARICINGVFTPNANLIAIAEYIHSQCKDAKTHHSRRASRIGWLVCRESLPR